MKTVNDYLLLALIFALIGLFLFIVNPINIFIISFGFISIFLALTGFIIPMERRHGNYVFTQDIARSTVSSMTVVKNCRKNREE